jgi:hypothetical protein
LEELGLKEEVATLWGERELPPGEERTVKRSELTQAVEQLSERAKSLGPGFEIITKHTSCGKQVTTRGPGGAGGLLMDGIYYLVRCEGRGWRISPPRQIPAGKVVPPNMNNVLRFDPIVLKTQSHDHVELKLRKGKRSDLSKLLAEITEFLKGVTDEEVYVTVG